MTLKEKSLFVKNEQAFLFLNNALEYIIEFLHLVLCFFYKTNTNSIL